MKRFFATILVILAISMLTSCNTLPNDNQGSQDHQGKENHSNKSSVTINNICSGYHEGLMFITTSEPSSYKQKISCIDKKGKTIFTIDAVAIISGFHNGLALVAEDSGRYDYEYVLCDKTGKITTPQQLGGDTFVMNKTEIFEDGYILVKKTTTSYQGSVDEMAVFNSKLEKIVDFSSELYDWYKNDYSYNGTSYYNGYLFDGGITKKVLDLRTGKRTENLLEWAKNLELRNKTDLWIFNDDFIYDYRDQVTANTYDPVLSPIIDLSSYDNMRIISQTPIKSPGYVDGYAALVFDTRDSNGGWCNYFTIMDENGNFCFEPLETQGVIQELKSDNGVFALLTQKGYVEVYDQSGKIASKLCAEEMEMFEEIRYDISDETIYIIFDSLVDNEKDWIAIYDMKFNPIFSVN